MVLRANEVIEWRRGNVCDWQIAATAVYDGKSAVGESGHSPQVSHYAGCPPRRRKEP
jgi:hypothetical protein